MYFLFLAYLNGRRRPTVFSGGADLMLLAVGLSGLFLFGPGKLLLPLNVLSYWGPVAWVLWTFFYLIVALIVVRKLRHRLVVYQCPPGELIPRLWTTVQELDDSAVHCGNTMFLPRLGVQFSIESAPSSRNTVLTATASNQNLRSWQRLEIAIDRSFRAFPVSRGPIAWLFLVSALTLIGIGIFEWSIDFPAVLETLISIGRSSVFDRPIAS